MSSKIKALNEEDQSLEEDPEALGKPLKEAQEELALTKYKLALQTLAKGGKKEGVDLLEEILIDPFVYSDNIKQFSPAYQKLQLGCLTVLGNLYRDGEYKDLERCKLMHERAIYFSQSDNNVTLWYRLGKVCFDIGDLHSAQLAFCNTLHLRPGHWSSLEHIVTTSYAIEDYQSCLNYCEMGLALDSGFFKGNVFLDLVYKIIPDLRTSGNEDLMEKYGKPPVPIDHQQLLTQKYLEELANLKDRYKQRSVLIKQQICIPTPKLQFKLHSLSLVEVVKEVLLAYEQSLGTLEFHKAVDVTWSLQDGNMESDDFNKLVMTEESQTEEESQFGIRRSRSSSDDKDNNVIPTDSASQQETDGGDKDKNTGDTGVESQQPDPQNTDTEEKCKKKNRRDIKWWQMEGKRRSQRVRGHLMPVSPDKTKKESSFTDQLKNLIPAPLLGDDGSISERESAKASEKANWSKKSQPNYFGTKEEETHVKQLLGQMSGINLTCVIANVVEFLTLKSKYPWPSELRDLFLCLYHYYRISVNYSDVQTYDRTQIIKDVSSCISFIEVVIEKFRMEFISGEKEFCEIAAKEVFFLEECMTSQEPIPLDLVLRVKWATVRRLLQMTVPSNDDEVNSTVCSILSEMETELRKEPIIVWTVNEVSNLICLESVCEKAVGIAKMQNSQVVTDLYRNQKYESLIGVLQSCINFSEIEKRDLSDILYYTVALHHTNNSDCIHHCLNLINQSIRFQDNNILSESLVLLEGIWDKMNSQFSLKDKRSTVGSLLKILVACERKAPSQESIMSVPWCLLHSVMYSLESEEPAFYLEEDTVPNSVLLLQMAHECMSRAEKCCVDTGKLMLYTMKEILKVKKRDEYFAFEETRLCMEQAIFCLYSHPSKKSKVKNLKDHNSVGTMLTWEMCATLYQYYCPCDLPEFDSFGSIGAEVESLFQRFLEIMPQELNPVDRQKRIQNSINTAEVLDNFDSDECFPKDLYDIYYLIGDYYFKSKEWSKAVTYYTWDLSVSPSRFDSWAAIALCLGESINTTMNTADIIEFKDLLKEAQSTAYCFRNALKLDPSNIKLRIEFGSFVYAMHAYCSRLMKQQQAADIDMDRFNMIEKAKEDFLKSSFKCFELIEKHPGPHDTSETVEEELWIHHYMLGKINEKMLPKEDAEEYLKHYELAGKLLHDQGAPYPSKMNYYSPPELAIEALEIYYRVHATILTLVETAEYSVANEKFYLQYIRRQENSPFIKCKLSKGDGADSKKGRKATEDTASKKDMAEITLLLNDLLEQTEKLVNSGATQSITSSATSSTTTEDESSSDSVKSNGNVSSIKPAVSSFSLTEFRKRLQEKEERAEKIATEAKKAVQEPISTSPPSSVTKKENIYDELDLENNHFYADFKTAKYGAVISLCLRAMEECISRYPSHFKSYYRLAYSYTTFIDDAKRAREYLMGSTNLSTRKISGLFGERKPTNFFNGIWRNPIDDVDRPGSFSYHMNKAMQLLLDVLSKLNDHQLLADIAIYLTRVPDNEKKYLSNPDREMFCQQAWNCSSAAVKRKTSDSTENFNDLGVEIFDTYSKFQKHNPRGHTISSFLHDVYRKTLTSQGVNDENVTVEHALRYFSTQHMLVKQTSNRFNGKGSGLGLSSGDAQKPGNDGAPQRKRGRRGLRQASQEVTPSLPMSQDLDAYSAAFAAALQSSIMPQTMVPLLSSSYFTGVSTSTITPYPTMHIDSMQAVLNPLLNLKHIEASKRGTNTPPPAHDSPKSSKSLSTVQTAHTSGYPPVKSILPQSQANTGEASDQERSGSKVAEQIRVKPVARKITKQDLPKDTSKYPPSTPVQSIRINTSPYKAQTTAVEQPPQFSYTKKSNQVSSSHSNDRKDPPAAHSHTTPKRSQTDDRKNEVEVEVIDLTVKTPEKDKDSKESQRGNPRNSSKIHTSTTPGGRSSGGNLVCSNTGTRTVVGHSGSTVSSPRTGVATTSVITSPRTGMGNLSPIVTSARTAAIPVSNVTTGGGRNSSGNFNTRAGGDNVVPSISFPKPSYVDLRAIAMNPIPSLPNHRPIIAATLVSSPSSRGSVPSIRPIVPQQRPKLISPKNTVATPRPITKPSVSTPRPNVANRNPPRPSLHSPYPLPPKKKHQMIFANPPPSNQADEDDDIVENEN